MSKAIALSNPLTALLPLVLDSLSSETTRVSYRHALGDFLQFAHRNGLPFTKSSVNAYRSQLQERALSASTINVRLAAIRKLAAEAVDNGFLDPVIGQGISRVTGIKTAGVRVGNWLTLEDAQRLITAPDPATLKGCRDRAALAILLGCGLRRQELVSLSMDHLAERDGRWVLIDIVGKGKRFRTVPMPAWAYSAVAGWLDSAGIGDGFVFRAIQRGRVGDRRLTTQAVYDIVAEHARRIGITVAPHDLRRSFAHLAKNAGGSLEQIQYSLGHSSITTTEKYVNCRQDLVNAPADLISVVI